VALLGLIFHSYIIFCKVCWVDDKNDKVKMLTMSLIVVGTSLPCLLLMSPCVVFGGKNLHHDDIKNKIGILCHRCVCF
jgi:hypothetical protein